MPFILKWKQPAREKMLFTRSYPYSFTFIKVTEVKNVNVRRAEAVSFLLRIGEGLSFLPCGFVCLPIK